MATKNLGKVAITPRGEWVAGTYEKLDLVSYQGSSYLSKKDGNTSAVTITADWLKVAEKGNKGDQGYAGWQPYIVADTTVIPGKTLLKLQDWIGGQGTKPTTNVGQWQTAAGGYTATAANALDLNAVVTSDVVNRVTALETNNLIYTYVHDTNLETIITSIDYATNVIISPAHSLVNANRVCFSIKDFDGKTPKQLLPMTSISKESFFVINVTQNSFQLSETEGGEPISFTEKDSLDYTKIILEKTSSEIVLTNLAAVNHRKIVVEGGILYGSSFYIGSILGFNYFENTSNELGYSNLDGRLPVPMFRGSIEVEETNIAHGHLKVIKYNSLGLIFKSDEIVFYSNNQADLSIAGFHNLLLMNGTVVKIYK